MKLIVVLLSIVGSVLSAEPLSAANNQLFVKLVNQLSDDKENVFISPFSISNALAMLYSGANGKTAQEMRQVLGFESENLSDEEIKNQFIKVLNQIKSSDKYELDLANKIAVQKDYTIAQTYKDIVQNVYKSEVEALDFKNKPRESTNAVNQWVSRLTRNKIKTILDKPLDKDTRLVVLNAIYFKSLFRDQFNKLLTFDSEFFSADNQQKSIKMMTRKAKFNYNEVPELDSQLLAIPYTGDELSLLILLPNERQGLKSLKNKLTDFSLLDNHIKNLREEKVNLRLPRFKIETKYSLNDQLISMGMVNAFDDSGEADFSGINGGRDLYLSKVLHKAYVEVNEEGTEAAGVTAGVVEVVKAQVVGPQPIWFIVDHPFAFFIRDNRNGMVLFGGHINQL